MIVPNVGRIVHYIPSETDRRATTMQLLDHDTPCAAVVTYVWNPQCINLTVYDHMGIAHSRPSIEINVKHAGPTLPTPRAEWMAYQIGQAAKAEALEAEARKNQLDGRLVQSDTPPHAAPVGSRGLQL